LKYSALHVRYSTRLFWLAVPALLAVSLLSSPCRATAQASAPQAASATQNAAQPAAAQTKEDSKSESQEETFRHAPIVRTMARMLHLDVETAARTFEYINFAIIFLLVAIPLIRIVPKIMRTRSQTLTQGLKMAREATADANKRLSAVETQLAGLDEEIKKFRVQVEQESLEDEARIKVALEEERTRIVASAEQEIGVAATHAQRELRNFATGLAIEQASKQLVLSPETDRALIAEFIGDVTASGANKEGQN
jgi:F-type H+-transporting ATPase subunit b